MTKQKEGEFVPGYALHEFPFFIWYTYPQLLLKNAAPRPGSFFDRHGSVFGRRQHWASLSQMCLAVCVLRPRDSSICTTWTRASVSHRSQTQYGSRSEEHTSELQSL